MPEFQPCEFSYSSQEFWLISSKQACWLHLLIDLTILTVITLDHLFHLEPEPELCLMPNAWDQRTGIVSKDHLLLTTQKIYSGQPKSHKPTLQQLIQIFLKHCTLKIKQVCWLKVAHQPSLNVPSFLGDLFQYWDFIYHLYTKMPHFYFWLTNSTPTQHLYLDASNSLQI